MRNINRLNSKKLGEILIDANLCTREQVAAAVEQQKKNQLGEPIGQILLDINHDLHESDIARALAQQFQLPSMYAANYRVNTDVLELLHPQLMYDEVFIPVDCIGNTLILVMGGLITGDLVEQIEQTSGREVFLFVSTRSDVLDALQKHIPLHPAKEEGSGEEADGDGFDWEAMFDMADEEVKKETEDFEVVTGQADGDDSDEFQMLIDSLGADDESDG
jgi:hypothetical protein